MIATAIALTIDPLFLRHDLMIELSRLEMAIEDIRSHSASTGEPAIEPLKIRLECINEALKQLPDKY